MDTASITAATAIIGAATGIAGFGLSIYNTFIQSSVSKPRLKVELSHGLIQAYSGSTHVLLINFSNVGGCNAFISSCSLSLPGGNTAAHLRPRNLPMMLEPRNGSSEFWEMDELKAGLAKAGYQGEVKLIGIIVDRTGKRYASRKSLVITV